MNSISRTAGRVSKTFCRPHAIGAFTLLEIMMVVGIMGIVLAMGLPSIVRVLKRDPLRQAASDVGEALKHARAMAILQGVGAEMILDADGQVRVGLRGQPTSDAMGEMGETPPVPGSASSFHAVLGQDVGVTSLTLNLAVVELTEVSEVRVRFHPNGTSDDFSVRLEDASGVVDLVLDPVIGLPEVSIVR